MFTCVGCTSITRLLSIRPFVSILIVFALSVSSANAYSQWEWKAFQARSTSGTIYHQGSSSTFQTKEQALDEFHDGRPFMDVITQSDGASGAPTGEIEYRFIAPPADPTVGPWLYYANYYDAFPEYGGGPHRSYQTEAEAIAELAARYNDDCYPTAEAAGEWYGSSMNAGWVEEWREVVLRKAPNCFGDDPHPNSHQIFRKQQVTCPAGYSNNANPNLLYTCFHNIVAYVRGRPLECPTGGSPSAIAGNPCNVATGDKSWSETDYVAPGISFTRYYHSAAPSASETLGANWSHSYSSKILFSGSTPTLLVRPSGYHEALESDSGIYRSAAGSGTRVALVGSGWIVRLSDGSSEVYSSSGELQEMVDSTGRVTSLYYSTVNSRRRLSSIVGPFGHRIDFNSDAQGRIASALKSDGNSIQYTYDAANNLRRVTQDGTYREFLYEDASFPNHLTGITDEAGVRFSTYDYDSIGRVTSSENAGESGRIEIAYGANTSTVTDAAGLETIFTFDSDANAPRRITEISRNGLTEQYQLEAGSQRRVTGLTDARGTNKEFSYDADHLLSVTEAVGTGRARTTQFTYLSVDDDLVTLERLSTAAGVQREISTSYNAQRLPVTRTQSGPSGAGTVSRTVTTTYTAQGLVQSIDGPRTDVNDVTNFTYYNCTTGYECGQLATVTNALGHVTTYNTYDAHGRPLTITDPNGVVTTLAYDPRGRLTSRTVGTQQSTFAYWPTGLMKKVTLSDGSSLEYAYDAAHRLTEIEDAHGNRVVYTLDAMGNQTTDQVYDPASVLVRTRTRVFNVLGQLWKELGAAGTANVTTTFGYDNNGNLTSTAAPLGRNSTQGFDELNRLTMLTDPLSGVSQYGYNALDQLISVTDPRSKVTTYTHNALGDVLQQVSPDTGTTTKSYDSAGNLATSTDARSITATFTYDALNRMLSRSYPDQTISYTYDGGTNQKGRLTQISDASGSTSWTYNLQGKVVSRQQSMGITKSVGYAYDSNGRLQSLTLPSGNAVTYGYTDGKVTSLTLNGSTTILSNASYQPFGPTTGWTWGNGTFAIRQYGADGQVISTNSAGQKSYGYDDALRVTGITDATNAALSQNYGYDLLDRLTSATGTSINQTWTYDANGNRLTQGGASTSTYAISSTSNRLSSITGALTRSYTYDAAGNITGDGTVTFVYNAAGRMTSSTKAGATTPYTYNGLGQRVKKVSSGTTSYFMYDESGHLLGEYNFFGLLLQEIVWLGDIPVAVLRPKTGGGVDVFYIHTDHLNQATKISRPSDNLLRWRRDPSPFGNGTVNQNPAGLGIFVFNLRLPGQYYDTESGLAYNYFRDYDAATGRYVQSDPIGLQGGINTYLYVGANPLMFTDPWGLLILCSEWERSGIPVTQHTLRERLEVLRQWRQMGAFPTGTLGYGGSPVVDSPRTGSPPMRADIGVNVDVYELEVTEFLVQPYYAYWDVVKYTRHCAETYEDCGELKTRARTEYKTRNIDRPDLNHDVGSSRREYSNRIIGPVVTHTLP